MCGGGGVKEDRQEERRSVSVLEFSFDPIDAPRPRKGKERKGKKEKLKN